MAKPIAADYGLACTRCGSDALWDRLFGDCYVCGLRGPKQSNTLYYLKAFVSLLRA